MNRTSVADRVFRPGLFCALAIFLFASGAAMAQQGVDAKIDQSLMQALTGDADSTAPFFVFFSERADLAAASRIPDWAARGRGVVAALQSTAARSQAGVRGYLQSQNVAYTPYWVMNAIYIPSGNLALATALSRRPEVAAILPERVHTIPPVTIQQGASTQAVEWNIHQIGADSAWATTNGAGITVANIDTGVRSTHEALSARFEGLFYDPTGRCAGGLPCDNNGHGTHTMGTMVGGNGIGVAPGANWIACKGCASNTCADSHLVSCAQWMLAPGGSAGNHPHVVNNSWGGPGGDGWYSTYVDSWRAAGIFPAFSAGNSGPACGTAGSPGDYPRSFASGATDGGDAIAYFSGRGPSAWGGIKPDVSAPGVNIRSSYNSSDSSYISMSGTSMASPHTAGTVALMWALHPELVGDIAATEQRLKDTAVKLGTSENCGGIDSGVKPNNTFGYGRIDASAAVLGGGSPTPPTAPTGVTATAVSSSQINLAWADNSADEAGFRIERSTNGGNFSEISTVGANVTAYPNTGLAASTTYSYRVRAYNAGGTSNYSNVDSATTQPAVSMHVGDLDGSTSTTRNGWTARVTVTVHDAGHNLVSGATVSGTWSGGYTGTGSCTTAGGTCTVTSGNIPKKKATVTFTVTNVTKSGYTYESSDNDSNGTTITINRP